MKEELKKLSEDLNNLQNIGKVPFEIAPRMYSSIQQNIIIEKLDDIAAMLNESGPLAEISKSLSDIADTLVKMEQRTK